jgi:L-lactate dehydrogenase (cytochrome)
MARKVAASEILQHNRRDDVWIVVDGEVYDMTEFAPEHPGGQESTF